MNKLAIYLRLSNEDYDKEGESESIHNQREYIKYWNMWMTDFQELIPIDRHIKD